MTGMPSGWQWFDAPDDRELHDAEGDPSVTITFARCFDSPDGDRVLQHLRRLTLERALGPGASDALLRHLEGQRQLVAYTLALVAAGANDR
jgi:hypothetical protein